MSLRIRLLNLALLAALALAVSRLWLFLREPPPGVPQEPPASESSRPARTADAGPPGGGGRPEAPTETRNESYDVIVARDVFSPARGVVPPAPAPAAKPAERPQPPPKLTLYGVVILDGEKTAYLQEGAQDARPRKLREGDSFAGGVVRAIRPDGVTFLFGGSEVAVPLRTPKEGAAAAPLPAAAAATGAGVVQRPSAPPTPATIPRRVSPPGVQQGRPTSPGRAQPATPAVPRFMPPAEPVPDVTEEEVIPEEGFDEEDLPDVSDEELEE